MDDLGVSRSAILKLWIYVAQGTENWWPVFNTVMNLSVLHNVRNFFDLLRDRWLHKNDSAPYS